MEKKIKQWPVIHHYVQQHVGLGRLLCYLACWRDHHKIEIDPLHLCVLVIKIGNGELETDLIDRIFLCKEMDLGRISEFDSVFSQRGLGRVLIDIFGAFASNFFRRKEKMLVVFAGRQFTIMPSEIIALHAAAIRTYYQLSLSDSISVLPNVNADEGEEFCSLIEGYPISIKVPRDLGRICSELIKKCGVEKFGCSYVATKVKERKFDDSVSICLVACGKMGNVMQFYDALSITPQLDLPCREKVLNLAEQTSEKLRCWNNELNAIKK
uniref:Uncharacterized protein n=1 Tax=Panagrolaimus sp. JU765 TaxID=591449 RepID=A0AC34PW41_9BILA